MQSMYHAKTMHLFNTVLDNVRKLVRFTELYKKSDETIIFSLFMVSVVSMHQQFVLVLIKSQI